MLVNKVTKWLCMVVAVLSAWGCTGGAPVQDTPFAAAQKVDATGWDRTYRDDEGDCVLNIRYLCDTIIAFEYTAGAGGGERQTWAGQAVNEYGWLACEFLGVEDGLVPADEFLYGRDGIVSVLLSMDSNGLAQVKTDREDVLSPVLKCD